MSIGLTINEIGTAIRSAIADLPDVEAAYGFGSFFRGEAGCRDIDVVVVAVSHCEDTLALFYLVRRRLEAIGDLFDLTLLTYEEFQRKPLLEHDSLTEVYLRCEELQREGLESLGLQRQ